MPVTLGGTGDPRVWVTGTGASITYTTWQDAAVTKTFTEADVGDLNKIAELDNGFYLSSGRLVAGDHNAWSAPAQPYARALGVDSAVAGNSGTDSENNPEINGREAPPTVNAASTLVVSGVGYDLAPSDRLGIALGQRAARATLSLAGFYSAQLAAPGYSETALVTLYKDGAVVGRALVAALESGTPRGVLFQDGIAAATVDAMQVLSYGSNPTSRADDIIDRAKTQSGTYSSTNPGIVSVTVAASGGAGFDRIEISSGGLWGSNPASGAWTPAPQTTLDTQDVAPSSLLLQEIDYDPAAPCFCAGTRIATECGDVPVETLQRGDRVVIVGGGTKPVKWIGRRTVDARFASALESYPIRIAAGALGESSPVRDLFVSPDHAMLVEGMLVQAGALVNGTSISRVAKPPAIFTYYHIELDDHELVPAEGAPAETFVDHVTRRRFDNWPEYQALYGDLAARIVEMDLPRAKSARQLPRAVRRHLAARADALGFGAEAEAA